jgi:hypothetical protein
MELITFWYLIHVVNNKKQYLASRTYGWMDNRISGEMVRVFVLSAVDRRLEPQSGKTRTLKLVFAASLSTQF